MLTPRSWESSFFFTNIYIIMTLIELKAREGGEATNEIGPSGGNGTNNYS
jgi:hypothetical protein